MRNKTESEMNNAALYAMQNKQQLQGSGVNLHEHEHD